MPQFPRMDPRDPDNMTLDRLIAVDGSVKGPWGPAKDIGVLQFPEFDHSVYPIPDADWDKLGPKAREILEQILPEFAGRFAEASLHYGEGSEEHLGPAGQFSDIWRKIGPLRRALWDGVELTRESPEEILFDLIGHCVMTIRMLRAGVDRRGA